MIKILIIIDYQNDFVDGVLGFEEAKLIEGKLQKRIIEAKKNNEKIIVTLDTHSNDENTIEAKKIIKHAIKNTKGWELHGEIRKELMDYDVTFFEKNTFGSIELAQYLKDKYNQCEIEICGIISNICVLSNLVLIQNFLPQAKIIIDPGLITTPNKELEKPLIEIFENLLVEIKKS